MNDAYKQLLKGHQNSEEILRKLALPIEEKPDNEKLETLKICLKELDNKKPLDEAAKVAIDWAREQKKNRAIEKGDRPLPDLAPQAGAISIATEILEGTGLMEALDQDAEAHAKGLAESVARAPFDGVSKRAEQIAKQAEAAEAYGAQVLDAKVTGKLNDPEFINRIVADIQKKREALK